MSLQNDQYNVIIRSYDRKQHNNRHMMEKKYREVYAKIPALIELDSSISEQSLAFAKLALNGDEKAIQSLQKKIDSISKEREKLLTANGYPADYLEPSYDCKDCRDTGYIDGVKCHCFNQSIVDLLYSQSNVKDIIQKENFERFRYDYYPDDFVEASTGLTPQENIKKVVKVAKEYIRYFDKNSETYQQNLLLYGNTGVGKTFLANCIAKELLDRFHTVIYLTSFELFDILEKNKFAKSSNEDNPGASYSYILSCDLLIIDDLGTELNNSFISSQLYHCINERLLNNKSTIISTNLSFDDLSTHYSERIFSRITSNYILLKITGYDIRLRKAMQN